MNITLYEMLQARERRAELQQNLLRTYGLPLISFTMNIAGPQKDSPLIRRGFRTGCQQLAAALTEKHIKIIESKICLEHTGCEAYYVIEAEEYLIKRLCVQIEDASPLGRLFDFDVLDRNGIHIPREKVGKSERCCIICGSPGRSCAARRLHPVEQLQAATTAILSNHFQQSDQQQISSLALRSLLDEVCITPKPGLVDRANNGSHKDMDIFTFTASASALAPYFLRCVSLGQQTQLLPPDETFALLRTEGMQAEQTMYQATGGVNTHKGAIFTMGIICGAVGRLWNAEKPCRDLKTILDMCSQMTKHAMNADFLQIKEENIGQTIGQTLYLQYGLTGIRGEAASGFPSVSRIGIPIFQSALRAGKNYNDASAITLLHLIASVSDTNMISRGGIKEAQNAATQIQALLAIQPFPDRATITELDTAFIQKNLSPGGCADLLAATLFLYHWCKIYSLC